MRFMFGSYRPLFFSGTLLYQPNLCQGSWGRTLAISDVTGFLCLERGNAACFRDTLFVGDCPFSFAKFFPSYPPIASFVFLQSSTHLSPRFWRVDGEELFGLNFSGRIFVFACQYTVGACVFFSVRVSRAFLLGRFPPPLSLSVFLPSSGPARAVSSLCFLLSNFVWRLVPPVSGNPRVVGLASIGS